MTPEAFPLQWPQGYPRTAPFDRGYGKFKTSFSVAVNQVINELRILGASYPVISTNQPLNRNGFPAAVKGYISDPGVAVYFLWKGKQRVFACDKWEKIESNLRAVALTIEAMRGMERWGVSQAIERSFEGFTALPAPAPKEDPWWDVIGIDRKEPLDVVQSVWRARLRNTHPDRGGTDDQAARLNAAMEAARREKAASP